MDRKNHTYQACIIINGSEPEIIFEQESDNNINRNNDSGYISCVRMAHKKIHEYLTKFSEYPFSNISLNEGFNDGNGYEAELTVEWFDDEESKYIEEKIETFICSR